MKSNWTLEPLNTLLLNWTLKWIEPFDHVNIDVVIDDINNNSIHWILLLILPLLNHHFGCGTMKQTLFSLNILTFYILTLTSIWILIIIFNDLYS